jgi:hypothetical protein
MNRIVDQNYLETVLQLSPAFIARHSGAMGCFARKPRRFFLDQVMVHLEKLAAQAQTRAHGRRFQRAAQIREMQRFADRISRKNKKMSEELVSDFTTYFEQQYGENTR